VNHVTRVAMLLLICLPGSLQAEDDLPDVGFDVGQRQLIICLGDTSVATYVFEDPQIVRPYFAHVRTRRGLQVTRNHPPVPEVDRTDHETMHPGIWMAFGDLDGTDFWRNKGRVRHVKFLKDPTADGPHGEFIHKKEYIRPDGSVVCHERFQCSVVALPVGWLLVWDSIFQSETGFFFGDQEEMGLGIRVASPLSEVKGGRLRDSSGRVGAKAIWSHSADWCDYSGVINGTRAGMTLLCHPDNFNESWMHARDYGFVAANAFGRHAMGKGTVSRIRVEPTASLRLRYAVWIHSAPSNIVLNPEDTYLQYVQLSKR
jgi:Family of unknown function (DUF6807)